MTRPLSNSIFNSLKGRIWLAVSALAILNCVFGLGAYLVVSFVVADASLAIFITFFVLAFVTMVFGWWLSNEVTRPIESVTLLAKSLERSPSASLPRTTGSTETDELLQTLHRNGQQLQNLITLMDDVAAGKTEAASMPIESADKLSASFQKLVSKVTDSISAKRDLDALQSSISSISKEISSVRNGKLPTKIRSDQPQTKEIADSLRYLTNRLNSLAREVYASTAECENTASEARTALLTAIREAEERSPIVPNLPGRNALTNACESLAGEMGKLIGNARSLLEDVDHGSHSAAPERAAHLKSQLAEISKKVQKLRNRSRSVSQLARDAQEISKRSNLISLNSSIGANGTAASAALLSSEMDSLSDRSDQLVRQVESINESLNCEIGEIEKEFSSLSVIVPDIAKAITSHSHNNQQLRYIVDTLSDLALRLSGAATDQSVESDRLTQLFSQLSDSSASTALVRKSEADIQKVVGIAKGLRASIADLDVVPPDSLPQPGYHHSATAEAPIAAEIESAYEVQES